MSAYSDFSIDFIKRTKANLENYQGEYDVTHLINCCLGLIIIPKETITNESNYIFSDGNRDYGISRKEIFVQDNNKTDEGRYALKNIVRHIRNGLAHGHIEQQTSKGQIVGLRIYDQWKGNENFSVKFSIEEFKTFALAVTNGFLNKRH